MRRALVGVIASVVCSGMLFTTVVADPAPRKISARCKKAYAKPFAVELFGARVQLRVVPYDAAGTPSQIFEGTAGVCRKLGKGWRVAQRSFGTEYLDVLAAAKSKSLTAALAACPVTYRNVDIVCPPCPPDSGHCQCAKRDIADWIFCTRELPAAP